MLGLVNTAVHNTAQMELVPPLFFTKYPEPGILSGLTSRLLILQIAPVHEEKWSTFAFLCRIHNHPKISPGALCSQLEVDIWSQYPAIVPQVGDIIVTLVEEWANEWLADVHTDVDVEKRLEGMVEEVAWGNVMWFAICGWQAHGNHGRAFNVDFFMCIQCRLLVDSVLGTNAEQHTSYHLISLPTHAHPSLR